MATTITRQFRRRLFYLFCIVIVLIILHSVGILRPFERMGVRAYSAVLRVTHLQSLIQVGQGTRTEGEFTDVKEANEEIGRLQAELQATRQKNTALQSALDQSDLAKKQLEYIQSIGKEGITASVIGKSTQFGTDTIVVNRGFRDGIRVGQAVITGESALVGVVTVTDDARSIIELITSPRFRVNGQVENEKESPGIVSGTYQVGTVMEYIPQFDILSSGQAVRTSGRDQHIPAGIPIGSIEKGEPQPGSLFQRAVITPFADVQRVRVVTIIQ